MQRWYQRERTGQELVCCLLFIIMEEQQSVQTINVLLRSGDIDELKVDIFDACDTLIATLLLSNYKRHTIHLKQRVPHLYCTLTNQTHSIEQQIELKMPDDQSNTLQTIKKFASFTIAIEVEFRKKLQTQFLLEDFLQQQNQLLKFANAHLRKLEQSVIKQLEVEELRKPFRQKGKNGKGQSIRKVKSKLNFTTLAKIPSSSDKKLQGKGYMETLKSLEKAKQKVTDESQPSLEEPPSNQATLRNKKYNTLFYNNPVCHTQQSNKESLGGVQTPGEPEPFYNQFVKTLQAKAPFTKQHHIRRLRQQRLSHNEQLMMCTISEIESQKKAFEMMKTISGNYSNHNSPAKLEGRLHKHKRSSPYLPLSSKTFIKRKLK